MPLARAVARGADTVWVLRVGRLEEELAAPRFLWQVAFVAFEISRRHRVHRDLERVGSEVTMQCFQAACCSVTQPPGRICVLCAGRECHRASWGSRTTWVPVSHREQPLEEIAVAPQARRRSSVDASSPRAHCSSSRERVSANPIVSWSTTSDTRPSALWTHSLGSSTNPACTLSKRARRPASSSSANSDLSVVDSVCAVLVSVIPAGASVSAIADSDRGVEGSECAAGGGVWFVTASVATAEGSPAETVDSVCAVEGSAATADDAACSVRCSVLALAGPTFSGEGVASIFWSWVVMRLPPVTC